jgi:hypothetical protein
MCSVSVLAPRPLGVGLLYKVRVFGNNLQEVFTTFFQVFSERLSDDIVNVFRPGKFTQNVMGNIAYPQLESDGSVPFSKGPGEPCIH